MDVFWDGRTSTSFQENNWHRADGTLLTGLVWTVGDLRPRWEGTHANYCSSFTDDPTVTKLDLGFVIDRAYADADGATINGIIDDLATINGIGGVVDIDNFAWSDVTMAGMTLTSLILRGSAGFDFDGAASQDIPLIYVCAGTHILKDSVSTQVRIVYLLEHGAIISAKGSDSPDITWNVSPITSRRSS